MAKFGIYEKALLKEDLEKSLLFAKESGYTFWEISIDNAKKERLFWDSEQVRELLDLCNRTSMPIFNMVLSLNRDYPLGITDSKLREEGINYVKRAVDLASVLGIRTIQIAGYYSSDKNMNDGNIDIFIESLEECVFYASSKGILLGIENMDYDITNSEQILKVIKKINNPYLGAFLDVGNFVANNIDPIREFKKCMPYLFGIHLKDTQEGVYRRIDYGKGKVDFDSFFEFLKNENYHGYFGIEMWNDNNSNSLDIIKQSNDWIRDKYNKVYL